MLLLLMVTFDNNHKIKTNKQIIAKAKALICSFESHSDKTYNRCHDYAYKSYIDFSYLYFTSVLVIHKANIVQCFSANYNKTTTTEVNNNFILLLTI